MFSFPWDRGLVSEVVGVKWVIRRGKPKRLGYGGESVGKWIEGPYGVWGW